MNKAAWTAALLDFVAAQRESFPVPNREEFSEEEEWQCRLIGGEFIGWYNQYLGNILAERAALKVMNFDPQPVIIFTTTGPGLAAAQEIIGEPSEQLIYLLHDEYKQWTEQHSVDSFNFHVQHWSYIEPIDAETLTRAQTEFPDVPAAQLRVHSTGDLWGERCGIWGNHLWRWTGDEMLLLEEAFVHGNY